LLSAKNGCRSPVYSRVGVNLNQWRHLPEFFETAEARGDNLPFCVALDVDPVLMIAAAFRYDGDEYEIAGALRGRPIETVRAKTCDLLVPATAEIVLECEILAHEREDEGPMAEYTGHYSGVAKQCVGRVKAITHRRHPIFETIAGASFEHLLLGTAVTREPKLKQLALAVSPRVRDVLLPPYASGFLALIAMDKPKPGEPRNVAMGAQLARQHQRGRGRRHRCERLQSDRRAVGALDPRALGSRRLGDRRHVGQRAAPVGR
jgi:2,5-furandicarboxylate decarboxylase 1